MAEWTDGIGILLVPTLMTVEVEQQLNETYPGGVAAWLKENWTATCWRHDAVPGGEPTITLVEEPRGFTGGYHEYLVQGLATRIKVVQGANTVKVVREASRGN